MAELNLSLWFNTLVLLSINTGVLSIDTSVLCIWLRRSCYPIVNLPIVNLIYAFLMNAEDFASCLHWKLIFIHVCSYPNN